jgi:hypothetical protein
VLQSKLGAGQAAPPPPESKSTSNVPECAYSVTGFDETSITNIPGESKRFWAHALVMLVVTLLILKVRFLQLILLYCSISCQCVQPVLALLALCPCCQT